MRPDATRDQGLYEIGAQARLRLVTHDPSGVPRSYEERKRLLDEYKEELKKFRRKVSLECHPDRTAELPTPEQERRKMRLRCINAAIDFLMTLKVQAPPPVRQMTPSAVRVVYPGYGYATTSTASVTSTTTTAGSNWSVIISYV